MNRPALPIVVFLAVALVLPLSAVKVKRFAKSDLADFQKGSLDGVAIADSGRLFLGPRVKMLAGPAEEFYLSLATAPNGDLFLGTGHNGTVYRVTAAGKSEVVFKGEQLDVYAMLGSPDGELFVATSPNGRLFRIGKDGKAKELFNPEEKFIWDLAEDKDGRIICALGNTGAVYSIGRDGQAENILQPEDAHIISLLVTRDNAVLAGSGNRGILYEIRNRKSRVLFDSPLEEVRGISEDGNGNVYFSVVKSISSAKGGKEIDIDAIVEKAEKEKEEKTPIKEKSIVYRLRPDGTVEAIWSSEQEYVYSQIWNEADNALLVGTGNSGHLYRIRPDGSFDLLWEDDSAQIFKLVKGPRSIYALGNNTAALMQIENGTTASGAYYSEILDARFPARYGKLTWLAETPAQTSVSFAVRAGNSDSPDKTWTGWSAPFTAATAANVALSGYRFLQLKVALTSANPMTTPSVSAFCAYYLESNLTPGIKDIKVFKPGENWSDSSGVEAEVPVKELRFKCLADDPNDDTLNLNWWLKKTGASDWVPLVRNSRSKSTILKTELYEDGIYQLKAVVDDSPDNAPETVKSASLVSMPFAIDSTAPALRDFKLLNGRLSFVVADDTSIVQQVEYSWDGTDWFALAPDDLILDSGLESFSFPMPPNPRGAKVLFIRAGDEYRNYKIYMREI
jgi:hypothetical protein